jgi:hypothetical protein
MINSLNSKTFGQFLLSIGITSVLAFIFLIIFFVGYFNAIPSLYIFGSINDILGSLEAILSAILATLLVFSGSKRWIWLNLIGAILSWTGAFIVTLDSLMAGGIISTTSASILRIKYGFPSLLTTHDLHFGFGLIGIWLSILNFQALQDKAWPNPLIGLGFFTGIIMTLGLAGDSPLGFVFLYPIWCIWLGRYILRSVKKE